MGQSDSTSPAHVVWAALTYKEQHAAKVHVTATATQKGRSGWTDHWIRQCHSLHGGLTCLLEEGAVRMELQRRGMRTLASFFSASSGLCAAASST